jgi:putative tryptophan/tyrosine transport system substrate-binding protein
MTRRQFVQAIVGSAAFWPLAGRAQTPSIPVIGFLNGSSPQKYEVNVNGFLRGLKETGYIEGQNVAIEYRWADGHYDQLPDMAADLVRRGVAVIAANTPATGAAKRAAADIPIVFFTGEDPVASGLVASLNRPGGNVTGVMSMFGGLAAKQFGLLRELVPAATSIALLVNPRSPITKSNVEDAQDAARMLGYQLTVLHAGTEAEIDTAFETLTSVHAGALLVQGDAFLINPRVVALAARHHVPAMYQARELVAVGGLIAYGPSISDLYRQMGAYTGRVLKGTKPADLPVWQPTKFELAINLKSAKALGLEIPAKLLALSDEVVE